MPEILNTIAGFIPETVSFFAGATVGSLATFRICKNTASKGGKIVDQSYVQAGKDIVGGNKTTVKK